jgi:uncharacterized protein (TIGR03437 family)
MSHRGWYPLLSVALQLSLAATPSAQSQQIQPGALRQMAALLAEKESRNPVQRKMDSHLVHAAKILRGEPVHPGFPRPPGEIESVGLDSRNYVEVDIQAKVTPTILSLIRSASGVILSSFPQYDTIRVRLPLLAVEKIAALGDVKTVVPARHSSSAVLGVDTSGDRAHQAFFVRDNLGYDGSGTTVGVISNGVDSLAAQIQAGNLPNTVTVLPNQAGAGDEGTAMLEVVHSLAPGATLYFATDGNDPSQMAINIQALATAGCQIIVDDIAFAQEGVFQDDTVAQTINTVTAEGVFYFSDAQNSGSLLKGTTGTWEGDFLDSGTNISAVTAQEATSYSVHNFGSAAHILNSDVLTTPSTDPANPEYVLEWSDPLQGSANDYDLFILDSTLSTVLASSTNLQTGGQKPLEFVKTTVKPNSRIVIVRKSSAATRALHLNTQRGRLLIGTTGATCGHNAAASAFTIAAASASNASGEAFTGGIVNPVESYSSDGPRRIFFTPAGSPIAVGAFTFASNGGTLLDKPDFTAADHVPTGLAANSGYNPFPGTSAAAPHAAAIAALILQSVPTISAAGMRAALTTSALDIEAPGFDVNSGAGIIMAPTAVRAALHVPALNLTLTGSSTLVQGQTGASFTIRVSNPAGGFPSSGILSVTAALPAGITQTSLSGSGWTCTVLTCSRSDILNAGASYPPITIAANVAANIATAPLTSTASAILGSLSIAAASFKTQICASGTPCPSINPGGVVPVFSASTTVQPGSWISLYGSKLASSVFLWNGDFPTNLGGVSVTINSKPAYLWYVSPTQINMQAPDDTATGTVNVTITTNGVPASSLVNLGQFGPSFSLFNSKYVAAIVATLGAAGNSGQGYDVIGPSNAFAFRSRPVKPGEIVSLYGVGFGPTTPAAPAGHLLTSDPAQSVVAPIVTIGGQAATVDFAGIVEEGLFQFNVVVPALPSGDQLLQATVANVSTPAGVYITVQ